MATSRRPDAAGGTVGPQSGTRQRPTGDPRQSAIRARLIITLCAIVVLASGLFAYLETRRAMRESQDAAFLQRRLDVEARGHADGRGVANQLLPAPEPPAAACDPTAARHVADAQRLLAAAVAAPAAESAAETSFLESLDRALSLDPQCVGAGRLFLRAHAQRGSLSQVRRRFIGRAEEQPQNAAAQLLAAMHADFSGESTAMHAFLEKATSARPDQPLLNATWAAYFAHHHTPPDRGQALDRWNLEVQRTGDLESLAAVIGVYRDLDDVVRGVAVCNGHYEKQPHSTLPHPLGACLEMAIRSGQPDVEAAYVARFSQSPPVPAPCAGAYLAHVFLGAGRLDEAIEHARRSRTCGAVYPWVEGVALIEKGLVAVGIGSLKRAANAPAAPLAIGLGLLGKRDEAVAALVDGHAQAGTPERILLGLLREELATQNVLAAALQREVARSAADRHARAGCGYARNGIADRAHRELSRALAEEPRHPIARRCALMILTTGHALEQALEVGEQARAEGLTDPQMLGLLGRLHESRGACEKALPLLERSQRGFPLDAALYTSLARCYRAVGRVDDARLMERIVPNDDRGFPWAFVAAATAAGAAVLGVGLHRRRRARRRTPPG
jgi:tetratricopeptide (TPR) repeat protein